MNDINKDLINLYRIVQNHPEEFAKQFEFSLISRFVFDSMKNQSIDTLTDIQKAARFYYLQRLAFGCKNTGQNFGTVTDSQVKLKINDLQSEIVNYHKRLAGVILECLDYKEIFDRYDREHTFFYIDPPYLGTQDYYSGKVFENSEYQALADILKTIKGKFILSINDTPEIREFFKDFYIKEANTAYTLSFGNKKEVAELLIKNFEDEITLLNNL